MQVIRNLSKNKRETLDFPHDMRQGWQYQAFFLETSVYTLSTSWELGDLLVLFLGGLSVLYVAIGADSTDQIKTLPVCTQVYCKSTWRRSIETVANVVLYHLRICLSVSNLSL